MLVHTLTFNLVISARMPLLSELIPSQLVPSEAVKLQSMTVFASNCEFLCLTGVGGLVQSQGGGDFYSPKTRSRGQDICNSRLVLTRIGCATSNDAVQSSRRSRGVHILEPLTFNRSLAAHRLFHCYRRTIAEGDIHAYA